MRKTRTYLSKEERVLVVEETIRLRKKRKTYAYIARKLNISEGLLLKVRKESGVSYLAACEHMSQASKKVWERRKDEPRFPLGIKMVNNEKPFPGFKIRDLRTGPDTEKWKTLMQMMTKEQLIEFIIEKL
jgi:hypothetical protein